MSDAANPSEKCPRCGQAHELVACPYVKAVEFDAFGRVSRSEFLTPIDFPREQRQDVEPDYPRLGPKP